MKHQMTSFDLKIRKRIQMLEEKIPSHLESAAFQNMEQLADQSMNMEEMAPSPKGAPGRYFYMGMLAAAATILLVSMMLLFYLFYQQNTSHVTPVAEANEVWLQDAMVEGHQARTFVINPANQDITIFWVEKINRDNQRLKTNNSNKGESE